MANHRNSQIEMSSNPPPPQYTLTPQETGSTTSNLPNPPQQPHSRSTSLSITTEPVPSHISVSKEKASIYPGPPLHPVLAELDSTPTSSSPSAIHLQPYHASSSGSPTALCFPPPPSSPAPPTSDIPNQDSTTIAARGGFINPNHPPDQPSSAYEPKYTAQTTETETVYSTVIPIGALQANPVPIDCPVCKKRGVTIVQFVNGRSTHVIAGLACFFVLLGCIPYLTTWFKDCEHKCSNCGVRLAVWKRSGRTEVITQGGE